jgi:hypothetical protein
MDNEGLRTAFQALLHSNNRGYEIWAELIDHTKILEAHPKSLNEQKVFLNQWQFDLKQNEQAYLKEEFDHMDFAQYAIKLMANDVKIGTLVAYRRV